MNKTLLQSLRAFGLASFFAIAIAQPNALCLSDSTEPSKPIFNSSASHTHISLDETMSLAVECSWEGNEDAFHFVLPPDFKLNNLQFLHMGETSEVKSHTQFKRFIFEFKPDRPGKATLDDFTLSYVPKNELQSLISHPIRGFEIIVSRPKSPNQILGVTILSVIVFGIFVIVFFLIAKRHKKPIQSSHLLSLEEQSLIELEEIALQIEKANEGTSMIARAMVQLASNYSHKKWPLTDKERRNKYERDDLSEMNQILQQLETFQFGGISVDKRELLEVLLKIKSLINKHCIHEPSELN